MYSSGGCSIPAAGSPSRNRFQSSVATADPRQVLGPVAAVVHVLVQRVREDKDDGAGQEVGQLTPHTGTKEKSVRLALLAGKPGMEIPRTPRHNVQIGRAHV